VKIGTENRNKVIAAISLVAVALVLMATRFSGFFGVGSSSAASPTPISVGESSPPERSAPFSSPAKNRNLGKKQSGPQTLDPTLRTDLLKISEGTQYEGTGRNIFRVFVEPPPPPIAPVVTAKQEESTGPPPPPPPPPIELKYYGYATPAGGTRRIFLSQGEDVFIAREGDIVDRRYKVVRISPNSVEILDVLSNNRQSIPLTQG
jgi:hypothetical protein